MFDDPETQCRRVIAPYASVLAAIPRTAWTRFMRWTPDDRLAFAGRPIQRANAISALMTQEATRTLVPLGRVQAIENSHGVGYLVRDEVFIRFKHLDEQNLSRNYPTRRALAYNSMEPMEGIPSTALRVDVGYRLNRTETEIYSVLVVRRQGSEVLWKFSLDAEPAVIALPIQRSLDEELEPAPAIRARGERTEADAAKRRHDREKLATDE